MLGERILVSRPQVSDLLDEQGAPAELPPIEFTIDGVAVAPTTSESVLDYGDRAASGYTLYRRGSLDLRKNDTVTVRGESGWQVSGDAKLVDWRSPYSGARKGFVADVRKAS